MKYGKNYIILYLTVVCIFLAIGWYHNSRSYEALEERVIENCVWLDFTGVTPEYCQKYIDRGYSIYEGR